MKSPNWLLLCVALTVLSTSHNRKIEERHHVAEDPAPPKAIPVSVSCSSDENNWQVSCQSAAAANLYLTQRARTAGLIQNIGRSRSLKGRVSVPF